MTIIILAFSLAFSSICFGQIRDYQTTQMISTAGTGIGSISLVESIFLNPSSAAFFKNSEIHLQKTSGKLQGESSARDYSLDDPKGVSAALMDASTELKGGLVYQNYKENLVERARYGFNAASLSNDNSSFGLTYFYTDDSSPIKRLEDKFHQVNIGYTQSYGPSLTLGSIYTDVFKANSSTQKFALGLAYQVSPMFSLLVDAGFNPNRSFSRTLFYSTAAVVRVYQSITARGGVFTNEIFNTKGYGYGLSWGGERFSLDGAIGITRQKEDRKSYLYGGESIREVVLSGSYRF
jgi:hypothetical protein